MGVAFGVANFLFPTINAICSTLEKKIPALPVFQASRVDHFFLSLERGKKSVWETGSLPQSRCLQIHRRTSTAQITWIARIPERKVSPSLYMQDHPLVSGNKQKREMFSRKKEKMENIPPIKSPAATPNVRYRLGSGHLSQAQQQHQLLRVRWALVQKQSPGVSRLELAARDKRV
ncbi:hypothetical protein GWK47_006260 [Chionoecetes opilio]|uniref:Uncharacterized protein n=1 Tax=Chionoecetes opilio TaxID=41210 RepID=A0A8J4YCF6_CHIOP|nr:hypothetical protein GWK47_006260 [Chionoecetes opilio]